MNGGPEFAGLDIPLWRCHKQVRAFKIGAVVNGPGGWIVHPVEQGFDPVPVPYAYISKHAPMPGGYFVVYRDGYMSYSPAKEFEDGYLLATELASRRADLQRQITEIDAAIAAQPKE